MITERFIAHVHEPLPRRAGGHSHKHVAQIDSAIRITFILHYTDHLGVSIRPEYRSRRLGG